MSISIYSTDQSTGVIYLITNLKNLKENKNPKYYIGSKSSIDEWNKGTYYGSSRRLLEDIKSQGKEDFKREILATVRYDRRAVLLNIEADVILQNNSIKDDSYYNKAIYSENFFLAADEVYEKRRKGIFTTAEQEGHRKQKERKSNGVWIEAELKSHKERSRRMQNRDYTDAELKSHKEQSKRKQKGEWTEAELKSHKEQSKRKQKGEWTEAELKGHREISQKQQRKSKGEFTDAEKEGYKKLKERLQRGDFTKAERKARKITGEKNRGTRLVNNGVDRKFAKGIELSKLLDNGWVLGRKRRLTNSLS